MDNRFSQMNTLVRKAGGNVSSQNIKKVEVKNSPPPPKKTTQSNVETGKKKCNCGRRKTSK